MIEMEIVSDSSGEGKGEGEREQEREAYLSESLHRTGREETLFRSLYVHVFQLVVCVLCVRLLCACVFHLVSEAG